MVGQDDEASAELIATIQHDHVEMKNFYNNHPSARELHARYGNEYPSFWRDVVPWPGWKETRKLFLKISSTGNLLSSTTNAAINESQQSGSDTAMKKRKSRWGSAPGDAPIDAGNSTDSIKRKSRWESDSNYAPVESVPVAPRPVTSSNVLDLLPSLPSNLTTQQQEELSVLQQKLKEANDRLANLETDAARIDALPRGHRDRSPSPPPVYDAEGKRKNTRAVRWRETYTAQRQECLEAILVLTNTHRTASSVAPSLFNRKRFCKIPIPIDEHPTYNFIGLIIGPRGKTQKDMENTTGCKIAIRGRGSVKEGARGRKEGKVFEGEDEPLHVLITGDNQSSVDAAADMIRQMLVVIDDEKNIHKQQQLRELALLNGTLNDQEYCQVCAEKGHKSYECPKRFSMSKKTLVSVKCSICGDTSHVSRDCMMNRNGTGTVNDQKQIDSDYLNFMAELDGKKGQSSAEIVDGATKICPAITDTGESSISGNTTGSSLIMTISTRKVKATEQSLLLDDSNDYAEWSGATEQSAAAANGPAAPLPTAMANNPLTAGGMNVIQPTNPITLPIPPVGHVPPSFPHISAPAGSNLQMQVPMFPPVPMAPPPMAPTYLPPQFAGVPPNYGQNFTLYSVQQPNLMQPNILPQQNNRVATGGWDYRNYYGAGHPGGDATEGAGFNWWDST